MSTLSQITEHKIVAIVRGLDPRFGVPVAEALYAGGIRILEITMNSNEPLSVIREVTDTFGDRLVVGAGTVLDADMAEAAVSAGAQFVLSPIVDLDVISMSQNLGGISTPAGYSSTATA